VSDIPEFTVLPPLRCSMPFAGAAHVWCGDRALWMHVGESPLRTQFFCERHHGDRDVPILGEIVLRRVSLVVEVLFAGVTFVPGPAHAEALSQLEAAVDLAGGILNLHSASSAIGRWTPPSSRGLGR
jgi:hypothetical protein